ncbi:MAG: ferredoxin, partial [Clostridiales bacterium]|nr:ferredoxin [Clostridiales bacterium]
MQYDNDAKQLKYQVLTKVAKYTFDGTLDKHIQEIPYDIIPGPVPTFRCCIYREREIIRERITSAQGVSLPGQDDRGIVGVLPAACEGCPISRFTVTDNCQKCLAKKCQAACPFGAISITGKGAYIDPAKCKE